MVMLMKPVSVGRFVVEADLPGWLGSAVSPCFGGDGLSVGVAVVVQAVLDRYGVLRWFAGICVCTEFLGEPPEDGSEAWRVCGGECWLRLAVDAVGQPRVGVCVDRDRGPRSVGEDLHTEKVRRLWHAVGVDCLAWTVYFDGERLGAGGAGGCRLGADPVSGVRPVQA